MTVLSTQTLRRRIYGLDGTTGDIFVSPLVEPHQVSNSAVDIRLGRHFIVGRPTRLDSMDILDSDIERDIARYQTHVFVHFGDSLVLHPGSSALGTVFEYVSLPSNVQGRVETRSSWGRLDITIATAVVVHPGYAGCLTLELENSGRVPVHLYPGARLGQLILHSTDEEDDDPAGRKYIIPTRPEFTRAERERGEVERFRELGSRMRGES